MQKAVQAIQSTTEEKRQALDDLSFQEWLEINGQSEMAISRFWNPISKLALNVDSSKSSAASAIFLFRKALLGKQMHWMLAALLMTSQAQYHPAYGGR